MKCNYVEQNIAEDYWCECVNCGNKIYGQVRASELNKLETRCEKVTKPKKLKVYYARPISLYNTKQEERDLQILNSVCDWVVVNPNKEELQEKYKSEGMDVFLAAVQDCDGLVFRSFQDGTISAGVKKEIDKASFLGKFVFELPTITSGRVLSVEDTREYLKLLGAR